MTEKQSIPKLPDDELKKFVLGLCDGKIFTSEHCKQVDMVPLVFMPLALGGLQGWSEEEVKSIGIFWEWLDQAGPRAINGMPTFMSVNVMHKEDWKRAREAYDREMKRREEIVV